MPSNLEFSMKLEEAGLRGHERQAVLDIADSMAAFKLWMEQRGVNYTAADLLECAKATLAREDLLRERDLR